MRQIPHGPEDLDCPYHHKAMSLVCHRCPLWVQVRGKHPQTNEDVDRWDCAHALIPMLLIENSQQQRQTGAAVESLRNEVVRVNGAPALEGPVMYLLKEIGNARNDRPPG